MLNSGTKIEKYQLFGWEMSVLISNGKVFCHTDEKEEYGNERFKSFPKQIQISFISFLFKQFWLVIEHGKSEVFHFSRLYSLFNPLSLDLSCFRDNTTLGLCLTESCLFNNISIYILIKHCQLSSVWKYSETLYEIFFLTKNIFFTEHIYFLLHSTVFLCGITTRCYSHTYLKSSGKYNTKLPYGY